MARTILRDAVRLEALDRELTALRDALDREENVPERFHSTLAGSLADLDAHVLTTAHDVIHRLGLWARYNNRPEEQYTRDLGPRGLRSVDDPKGA